MHGSLMTEKLKTLALVLALIWSVAITTEYVTGNRFHLQEIQNQSTLLETERASRLGLQSQIDAYSKQQINLLEIISTLDTNVKNLKFNSKTETKVVAKDPLVEYEVLPATHAFDLANGLRVAEFEATDSYKFKTYDLSFRSVVVATDNKASSVLEVKSSYDDQWIEVEHDLQFNNLEAARKLFEPQIVLGTQLGIVPINPAGLVGISFIHPTDSISLGTVGIGISKTPTINLYPIDYNIGKPLPVLEDLHIAAGVSGSLPSTPNVAIGIWTTL